MRNSYAGTPEANWVWPASGPQLVRWGSVFAGTIIAIGAFILLGSLWLALSFVNHDSVVYNNLSWWIAGTAIFCMFLAGLIAGLTSGARGAGAGGLTAVTTWGLVAIAVAVVVVPTFSIGHVPTYVTVSGHVYRVNYLTYWTAFWSVLIGLGAALLGGLIGGMVPRRVDGPYLDLSRATARETPAMAPMMDRRQTAVEQTAPVTTEPSPVGAGRAVSPQEPTDVAPGATTEATAPISPDLS
ncbi:MAG TPA: hypothetical protein VMF65_04865 [Acidimicrobiales bacterium]|nr:hypothetical protein [Acidimicrobiales bacterium]